MRGKAISEFRSPNALPRAPTPLGTEGVLRCCVCCVVDFFLYAAVLRVERCADLVPGFFDIYGGTLGRSRFWILQYLWWYAMPISSLYSSILIVVRWADLVSGFFGTYKGTLRQSGSGDSSIFAGIFCTNLAFQDRTPSPLPSPVLFFSCRLEASARGRWHRAGLLRRRGDYYLGCGRRRYCGRDCCLSRRRVLALPQCF